ncbi:MAG: hypothetical protein H0X13_19800 [Ramlibacter sp.]|nr:hypothetical protein [Ramlibacter sp.]
MEQEQKGASKVLDIIRTAAADCTAQGNTMAANELLDAASMTDDLLAALNLMLTLDSDCHLGKYRPDRAVVRVNALQAIAKATGSAA